MNDENHIMHLSIFFVEQGWDINQRSELFSMLNEDESWWNKMSKTNNGLYQKTSKVTKLWMFKKEKEKEDKPKTKGDVKTSEPISGINDIQTDLENKRDKGVRSLRGGEISSQGEDRYCNDE